MELTFASYNIRKAVGLDGRRDPERILAVLREIDADVVALQEADRRFGRRAAAIPRRLIEEYSDYRPAPLAMTAEGMAWHGNSLLVRRAMGIALVTPIPLPVLEPRGAVCTAVEADGGEQILVAGMHLCLSGMRRRGQIRAVLAHVGTPPPVPTVLLGDFNQWSHRQGAVREFGAGWQLLTPGRSFPANRPLAALDRIVASRHWRCLWARVHHSRLAAIASDHLPVVARLALDRA